MATFSYKGVSKNGKNVKGVRESASKQSLTSELLAEGIFVTDITDVRLKRSRFERFEALFSSKKNLADTFFQLSLLLRSGIPLVEAIKIIAKSTKQAKLKNALLESAARVSEGMRFSEALSRYQNIFDPMYVNLIKASEQVGRLSSVLADIAVYEEDKRKNSDKLSSAMIYPMTILILGMGVLGFLLTFVVPKMESIFETMKQDIPATTEFLLSASRFMGSYGLYLLLFILFIVFFLRYMYKNNKKFRLAVDKRLYKMNIVANVSVAKFAHVLAFQLKEGLPLTDAIHFASETINNRYLRQVAADVRSAVQSGTKFSVAVKNAGVFPELFPAAVSTGESSGNMPELLERVNEFYSKQVDKFLSSFVSVIEPLFIVFIGVLVGFIVVSIMEPLFQMNTLVK
ncbi:MAG: type II secretion system F family protein [Deferribacterales bacterium]|nr:type II secretion system F family protein [Deferribacterales bacterium]